MSLLLIHIGGPLRIAHSDGADVPGLSRRAQALLAYLALQPGQRAERGGLADLLWSDRSEAQARASLRQELSVLRRAVGEDVLQADRQAVWLCAGTVRIVARDGEALQGFDLASEGFEVWLRQLRNSPPALPTDAPVGQSRKPALAIMPFEEFGAPEADMFADGVVEEITGALSRVRDFDVIARQSALALTGQALSLPEIAARLSADYIVEGSVRRAGERVRISVQLVRGGDGHTLWAERFDDRLDDLFDLQDRIAAQVAGQLSPNLRAAEIAAARSRPPSDRTAYELTLSALPHFWTHRGEENLKAIALLEQALSHAPDYAPALAYKAWCHAHHCCYLWTHDGAADKAQALALAERAAPLAQDDAATLVALSAVAGLAANDFVGAKSYADRALTRDPNNAWGWLRSGWTLVYLGDFARAFDAFDRYDTLSPLDPFHFNGLLGRACAYRSLGRYDEAVALIEQGMREGSGIPWAYRMLYGTHYMAGNMEAAMEAGRKWRAAFPHVTWGQAQSLIPKWTHDPGYMEALKTLWQDD